MARALRIEFEDALYHVCARGNARGEIFRSDTDRARFLQLLERSAERFFGTVLCFVLMDNYFHLVVRTHRPNLEWSSYRGYAGLAGALAFIEEITVFDEPAGGDHAARLRYRRFVEEGL